jgi:hypothetical protein
VECLQRIKNVLLLFGGLGIAGPQFLERIIHRCTGRGNVIIMLISNFSYSAPVRPGETTLEPGVPELICRANHSQDLALTGIVKKLQQPGRSFVSTS